MVDREMLSAIAGLLDEKLEQEFDEKLQPVYERLDGFEANVIPRLDRLETGVSGLKTDVEGLKTKVDGLETDVGGLKDEMRYIRVEQLENNVIPRLDRLETDVEGLKNKMQYVSIVQLENSVIPRLSTIESCYLDTSRRYVERTEQFDKMTADIEVLKSVVSEHSGNWKKYRGRRVK